MQFCQIEAIGIWPIGISSIPPIGSSPLPNVPSIAVVAQRRAPAVGDIGARLIFGIFGNWCVLALMPSKLRFLYKKPQTFIKQLHKKASFYVLFYKAAS